MAKTGLPGDLAQQRQASRQAYEQKRQAELRAVEQLGKLLEPRGWIRSHRPRISGVTRVAGSFEWPPSRSGKGVDPSAISIVSSRVEVFLADAPHEAGSYHRTFPTIDSLDEHVLAQIEAYRCPPLPPGVPDGFTPNSLRPRTLEGLEDPFS